MGLLKKLLRATGILLFAWILYAKVNVTELPVTLSRISLPFLFLSIFSMILVAMLKYTRIFLLLRTLHVKADPLLVLKIYTSSILLGHVTTPIVSTLAATAATILSQGGKNKVKIGNAYVISNVSDFFLQPPYSPLPCSSIETSSDF